MKASMTCSAKPFNVKLMLNVIAKIMMSFNSSRLPALRALAGFCHLSIPQRIPNAVLSKPFHSRFWTKTIFSLPCRSLGQPDWTRFSSFISFLIRIGLIVSLATWNAFISVSEMAILLFIEFIKWLQSLAGSAFSVAVHIRNPTISHGTNQYGRVVS